MARWSAIRYTTDHILDYIEMDETHGIYEMEIPEEWLNKTIGEIDIRKKYGINILGIKGNGEMNIKITSDTVLTKGYSLIVLGENKSVKKCFCF